MRRALLVYLPRARSGQGQVIPAANLQGFRTKRRAGDLADFFGRQGLLAHFCQDVLDLLT